MLTPMWTRSLQTGRHIGRRPLFAVLAGLIGLFVSAAAAPAGAAPVRTAHLELELVAAGAVAPGGRVEVALRQVIAPGWHTYWRNPGDAGEPTQIDWTLPAGWTAGPITWPAPERAVTGPLMNYVYSREALLPSEIRAPASAAPGSRVTLTAHASLLVCKDICVPEDATLSVDLPVSAHADPDPRWGKVIAATLAAAPRPSAAKAVFELRDGAVVLSLRSPAIAAAAHAAQPADLYFYPFSGTVIDQAKPQRVQATAEGLQITLTPGYDFTHGKPPEQLSGVVALGAGRAVEIAARAGQVPNVPDGPASASAGPPAPPAGADAPPAASAAPPSTAAPADTANAAAAQAGAAAVAAQGLSFPAAVALALLGGLVLNLMPCVFPVLSMKAAALARHTEHPAAARAEGLAYLAGVVLAFVALAAALIAARHAGEAVGWGFQLQSPGAVAVLVLVMLGSALNLSGLFEFGLSAQGAGAGLASRPGLPGAFFTGVLAVVVAAPCTGPFMASTIGWALAQSEVTALAVFAALGVGLAAPFVALAFAPGLYRLMPRPGAWMDGLRKTLAFPMYGAAAWLAWVFVEEAGADALPWLFAAALLLAFGFWLWGVSQRAASAGPRQSAMVGAGVALVLAVVALNLGPKPAAHAGAAGAVTSAEVQPWSPARPAELQAQGKPVFVDFTAAWCVTCKVNEGGALASSAVKAAFQRSGAVYLRADWTNRNAEIAHALQAQGRAGVPLYLVYSRRGGAPQVLPQLLTEADVVKALDTAGR